VEGERGRRKLENVFRSRLCHFDVAAKSALRFCWQAQRQKVLVGTQRARWVRKMVAFLRSCHGSAPTLILLSMGMLLGLPSGATYEAPIFYDFRGPGPDPCLKANGCLVITDEVIKDVVTSWTSKVSTPSDMPYVTPPDGYVFYGRIGGEITYWAAGQHASGKISEGGSMNLMIIFEEDPFLMGAGAFDYAQSSIDRSSVSIYKRTAEYVDYNAIARKFSVKIKKFAPSKMLTMCFRIMIACNPGQLSCPSNNPDQPCGLGVGNSSCANCCFRDAPADEIPQSYIWEHQEMGAGETYDAPTTDERPCYRDIEGR
jgi:hypothetical protein